MSKQTDEMINRLITATEENRLLTLKELAEVDHNKFDVDICIKKELAWYKLFTVKNTCNQINNMNLRRNKVKSSAYFQTLYDHRSQGRTSIFIHERNLNLYYKRTQGRSKISLRTSVILPSSKILPSFTVLGRCLQPNLYNSPQEEELSKKRSFLSTTRRGAFKGQILPSFTVLGRCLQPNRYYSPQEVELSKVKEWFREWFRETCNGFESWQMSASLKKIKILIDIRFIIDNAPAHSRLEENGENFPNVKRQAPYSYLMNHIEFELY